MPPHAHTDTCFGGRRNFFTEGENIVLKSKYLNIPMFIELKEDRTEKHNPVMLDMKTGGVVAPHAGIKTNIT